MKTLFYSVSAVASVVMTVMILLQQQGSGLGGAFGGDTGSYRSRRGVEKIVFNITIVAAVVFVLSLVLGLLATS